MKAFVALGKHGDICSVLPILQDEWLRSQKVPALIVAKEYTAIPRMAPNIAIIEYPGDKQDLAGAIKFAKRGFSEVIPCATYGHDNGTYFPIQKRHPSFQFDQWDRAGALEKWDTLPLILQRPPEPWRITDPALGMRPCILFADKGQSSPFLHAADLAAALEERFGKTYRIVRLSEIKLDSVADFLTLYDRATCLVSTETIHLHLAKASGIPIVALVTDSPSRWHGSAWSSKFSLYVRYSAYQARKQDILDAVTSSVNKQDRMTVQPMPYAPPLAYNPCILQVADRVWTTWRIHPDKDSWRTEVHLHDGEQALPLIVDTYEKHSIEDARLFLFRKHPHVALTISRSPLPGQKFSPCIVVYGELMRQKDCWRLKKVIQPKYGKNEWNGQEKNWVCWEHDNKLHVSYQSSPEHIVAEIEGERHQKTYRTPCPPCAFGHPRGGTQPIPYQGALLRFIHTNDVNPKSDQWWTYCLGALLMEAQPPFRILKISGKPILIGNEQYFPGHKFWKTRVIFPMGVVPNNNGWQVSLGINDSQSASIQIRESDLKL